MQARASLEKAELLLKQAGADLRSVARTWIFIDDILSWYGRFNQVRNAFFHEQGLLGPGADGRLPASTGIGISPANGSRCAIDLFAALAQRVVAAVRGRRPACSAYEYGSAFARATVTMTPAGRTIFVSGTAAIDANGATVSSRRTSPARFK